MKLTREIPRFKMLVQMKLHRMRSVSKLVSIKI